MSAKRRKLEFDWSWIRPWFDLTGQERLFLGGILAIALVGLFARYLHLRNEKPAPYRPAAARSEGSSPRAAEASAYKGTP